jgi:hypothetical protein
VRRRAPSGRRIDAGENRLSRQWVHIALRIPVAVGLSMRENRGGRRRGARAE